MFSVFFESLFSRLNVGFVTDFFVFILVALFFASVFYKRKNLHQPFTHYAPTLLTTLGILGTFFGIVIGLLGFDVTNIDGSIEALLGGMKTAFITSLVGMLLAVIYKTLVTTEVLTNAESGEMDADQIGAAELYGVLQEQRDGIVAMQSAIGSGEESSLTGQMKLLRSEMGDTHKTQLESLEQLNKAIGSGDESSLTGQMKLLRTDIGDAHKQSRQELAEFQDKLWTQLQEFADMMSKSATEAVIDALREVITDFNNNLTEQFGENFKELNKAVEKLVQWQENYKEQIEQMTHQYAQGVTAITETETAVASIQEHTLQIPESMKKLTEVIQVNQHQLDELARHLEAFKDVREKAVDALPQLKEQISLTVASVENASTSLLEGLGKSSEIIQKSTESTATQFKTMTTEMTEHSRQVSDTLRESGKALEDEAVKSRKQFESGLETMRDQLNNSLEMMAEQQASKVQGLISGLKESMEESIRKSAQAVEGSVEIIDQALQAEINRTMEQMGGALVSITGKFTEDYQGLVNQMQRVVRTQPEL